MNIIHIPLKLLPNIVKEYSDIYQEFIQYDEMAYIPDYCFSFSEEIQTKDDFHQMILFFHYWMIDFRFFPLSSYDWLKKNTKECRELMKELSEGLIYDEHINYFILLCDFYEPYGDDSSKYNFMRWGNKKVLYHLFIYRVAFHTYGFKIAASHGCTQYLEYARELGYSFSFDIIDHAVKSGKIDTIRYLMSIGYRHTLHTISIAIHHNQIDILKYLLQDIKPMEQLHKYSIQTNMRLQNRNDLIHLFE